MLARVAESTAPVEVFARLARARSVDLVVEVFSAIVERSFVTHPMRRLTDAEVKRRTDLLERWLRKLCDGQRWPIDRALHCLHIALAHELDGRRYEPPSLADQTLVRVDDLIEPMAAEIRRRLKASDLAQ